MSDLRTALEEAIKENETTTPEASPAEQTSSPETSQTDIADASAVETSAEPVAKDDTSEKDESAVAPPTETKPEPKAEQPAPDKAVQETAVKQHRIDRPPQSWKGQAKGEWAAMPLAARQEIHRREVQIEKALQETAPARHFVEQFNKAVTPYTARIQAMGLENPIQAVEHLLQADYALSSAPKQQRAALMAKFIKDYDIDIYALDSALAGAQAQAQPQPQPLGMPDIQALVQQQLQQALAPLMQREQAQRQQAQQNITDTVESMALDPKYPFFDEVRNDMADIIDLAAQKGINIDLPTAYNKAVRLNDEVYAQTAMQTTMQNANQQHAQALKAKAAASSVTGAPAGGGSGQFIGNGDLRSSIEAAFGGARL